MTNFLLQPLIFFMDLFEEANFSAYKVFVILMGRRWLLLQPMLQEINVTNIHPVSSARFRTYDLPKMSLLIILLNQSSRPPA